MTKQAPAKLKHLSAPLKGLNLSSQLSGGDPLTAPILNNFVVEEDRITCRPGTLKAFTHPSGAPIWHLIPYYGNVDRLACAVNGEITLLDGTVVKAGFTGNDWHWTSFSNLAANEFTVMVNGLDGVWSWDGGTTSTPVIAVVITSLSNANPAVATVGAGDIAKFYNGQVVQVKGATATGFDAANGQQLVVNIVGNTFQLYNVDTSSGAAPMTTGLTAEVSGTGLFKETVTAPSYLPHIQPNQFNIVCSHMNRLFFADKSNLSIYYLPIQQKSGEVTELPLNAVFKRGGNIRALYQWTTDGGSGLDDMLCIFSSNGEVVIYRGVDPDSDFTLVGIFRFDSPMSKHCVVNYGGDLFCLISTGLVPMSTLLKAEGEQLGQQDRKVLSHFRGHSRSSRSSPGWQIMLDHTSGHIICNLPHGAPNDFHQLVRKMADPIWTQFSGLPARCWGWISNRLFFGSDSGIVYEMSSVFQSDDGKSIFVDVQPSWGDFGSPAVKQFKMVLAYITTDGTPKHKLDFRVDYDQRPPQNVPDFTTPSADGASWDTATWDVDYWAGSEKHWNNWQGVSALGRVGAPRLTAEVLNCSFSISGFDVLHEQGGLFG